MTFTWPTATFSWTTSTSCRTTSTSTSCWTTTAAAATTATATAAASAFHRTTSTSGRTTTTSGRTTTTSTSAWPRDCKKQIFDLVIQGLSKWCCSILEHAFQLVQTRICVPEHYLFGWAHFKSSTLRCTGKTNIYLLEIQKNDRCCQFFSSNSLHSLQIF